MHPVLRQQCGGSTSGFHDAHAACKGKRRQGDMRRSAVHAHGRQGRHLLPHQVRNRRGVPDGHAAPHIQERLGRQGLHQGARLRHGQGARRSRQVDAGESRRSDRHERGGSARRRRVDGQEPAEHHRLGHGPDPAHQRQRDCARELHTATGARQRRRGGRRLQYLSRP